MLALQPLLAFSETAKLGGFAAAARVLGTSPSALAKAVGRLEASLGLRLFYRTTRQVTLTADGERLFERCQRVLAELDELQADVAGARAGPSGTLRIDLPIVFGMEIVLPILARLATEYPALALDVRLSDAFVDLVKEGIDVAIRMGDMQDSTLVARRFASQSLVLVAAPSYLERMGTPRTLNQLAGYDHITFRLPTSGRPRPQQFSVNGKVVALHPASRLRFDDGVAIARAAMLGLGLAQVPDNMVHRELASGQLVEVLPQRHPPIMPISAVVPSNRMIPSRVRALLDALDAYAQEQRVAAAARATVNKPPRTRSKARAN